MDTNVGSPMPASASAPAKTPGRAAASGFIGSALEYYDFAIYGQAAALVFPAIFFPTGNPAVAVIASLATYAVGYVARPLGAIVLGHWGDRVGRKSVLVFAMLLMGCSTFAVGLLPTYQAVGALAPALLVALRLIQGFAVAGELSGASAMIIEHAPEGRRGYFASFPLQGTQAGQALGAGVFIPLAALLPDDAFQAWGWRVPFFLSALVVVVAYVIRRRVQESPEFTQKVARAEDRRLPVWELLHSHGLTVLLAILMAMVNIIGTTVVVFGTAFATQPEYGVGMSAAVYLWIPVVANLLAIIVIPFFGGLSDRIGRRPVMITGSLASAVLLFPYLMAIKGHHVALTLILAVLLVGLSYQMWNATFASFFQELFPARSRVTGFAVAQNVGLSLVALSPTLFAVIAPPGSAHVPALVGTASAVVIVIAVIATLLCPETHRLPLAELGTRSPGLRRARRERPEHEAAR